MASTILLSDNGVSSGSAGLKETGGNDGVLILQTSTAGGTATNAVTIDGSQNVGIGTSSPAAKLDIVGATSNQIRVGTAASEHYRIGRNASDGFLDFYGSQTGYQGYRFGGIDGTRVTIDTSGNVGIGVTPSATWSSTLVKALQYGDNGASISSFTTSNTGGKYNFFSANAAYDGVSGSGWKYIGTAAAAQYQLNGNSHVWNIAGSGTAGNAITWTQAMTLDTSGNLIVGTGASGGKRLNIIGSGNLDVLYQDTGVPISWNVGPIGTGIGRFNWYNAGANSDRMYLTPAGALYNITGTYGTISDVSVKENIVDATPKLADVMRIQVRNFNLKADPDKRKMIGVVAQELEQVFPGLTEETINRVPLEDGAFEEQPIKAVKYSVLTTILVKAIQEQQALITTLTERITALEAK
jgi:hypothetical protein